MNDRITLTLTREQWESVIGALEGDAWLGEEMGYGEHENDKAWKLAQELKINVAAA